MTDEGSLTIDGLAVASGVPSRTIRLYQTKGVLPPPERRGRVAFYGDAHLERLRLIGELQDRGLQLSAIRDLLEHDGDVGEWLGLGERMAQPWSEDRPRFYSASEVATLVEGRPPGTLAELVRTGILTRVGDGAAATYLASPGLLRVALELEAAGIDLQTGARAGNILRKRLHQAAEELVTYLTDRSGNGFGTDASPQALAVAFDAVRRAGGEAARLIFADEVEAAMSRLLARGYLPPPQARRH